MDTLRKVFVFDDTEGMSHAMVEKWSAISHAAIGREGGFVAALSGGKTPRDFYQRLAVLGGKSSWRETHIFLVDERFVPFTHSESNYGMMRHILLDAVDIPGKNCHPIPVEEPSPEISARKYEEDVRRFFRLSGTEYPEFDLIVLGIGEDGHTASLFPGSPLLKETRALAASVMLDAERHNRITVTLPVINNAKNVIFLVSGNNKATAVKKVVDERESSLPASVVMPRKGNLLFLLDAEAGSLLSRKDSRRKKE